MLSTPNPLPQLDGHVQGGRVRSVDVVDVGAGFDQGGRDALDSVADDDVEQRGRVVSHIGTRPITQIQLLNVAVVTT
jgi:hypothetical protein